MDLGTTRTSDDFVAHLRHAANHFPEMDRYHWVLDNLNTHWSLPVCALVAEWCDIPLDAKTLRHVKERRAFLSDPTHKHVFHFTPKHGSWLNQVELWFGVLGRRFLAQGDFRSAETSRRDCGSSWTTTTISTPIPIAGLTPASLSSATRHSAEHADRSNTASPGSALDPKDSSDCFTRPDPIDENSQHDCQGLT